MASPLPKGVDTDWRGASRPCKSPKNRASRRRRARSEWSDEAQAGGQVELTGRWRGELDEAERAIRKLEEETLPSLRSEEKALRESLRTALQSLSAEWSADEQ